MEIPRALRKQVAYYANEGFDVVDVEFRSGSHVKLTFAQFPEPQFMSRNPTDPRGWKNNIARFRRLAKEQNEQPV